MVQAFFARANESDAIDPSDRNAIADEINQGEERIGDSESDDEPEESEEEVIN